MANGMQVWAAAVLGVVRTLEKAFCIALNSKNKSESQGVYNECRCFDKW